MPTAHGTFTAHCFRSLANPGVEHMALVKGTVQHDAPVLVRVHSECCTGDIFGSLRCDCGPQLQLALRSIESEGSGVLLYMRGHEGRGIGLGAKMKAYVLQEQGLDTLDANTQQGLPADARDYGEAAAVLRSLGVGTIRLISVRKRARSTVRQFAASVLSLNRNDRPQNNPDKLEALASYGLVISERVESYVVRALPAATPFCACQADACERVRR
jgi:GTP cyclohydrolase II